MMVFINCILNKYKYPMLISLFPTYIYKTRITGVEELLPSVSSLVDHMLTEHYNLEGGALATFDKHHRLHEEPVFSNLIEQIDVAIKDCWKEFKFYQGLEPFISECWINRYKKDSFINSHNHSPYQMSGVLYLRAGPQMGNIVFENPNYLVMSTQPFDYQDGHDEAPSWLESEMEVSTGDLLLFPGWLRHRTLKNNTDKDRYIMSFNVGSKGSNWNVSNQHWSVQK
jgi:uncharacterized protein (TIGR02466 family)